MPTKAQLNTEIKTDPAGLGYVALLPNYQAIADKLNDVPIGLSKGYTLTKAAITAPELQACVVVADWVSRTADQKSAWQMLLIAAAFNGVPTKSANIVTQVNAIWSGAATTLANLSAAISRTATRAEKLWGEGVTITETAVVQAIFNDDGSMNL